MSWEKIDEMFPDGYVITDNGTIPVSEIVRLDPPIVELTITKPIRETTEYEEKMIWCSNGDVHRFYTYSVFPYECIDNIPIFNAYVSLIYKKWKEENE